MMQSLYRHLEARVRHAPALWEFAFCLHRWMVDGERGPRPEAPSRGLPERLTVRLDEVAFFEREGEPYWVHVGQQRAFRVPLWARGLHGFLAERPRDMEKRSAG